MPEGTQSDAFCKPLDQSSLYGVAKAQFVHNIIQSFKATKGQEEHLLSKMSSEHR